MRPPSTTFEYWEVDAFCGPGARGNRAAVVLIHHPLEKSAMQKIAQNAAVPATAFLTGGGKAMDYATRWFSPNAELGLCGHASLASAYVLYSRDGTSAVRLLSHNGITVATRIEGGRVAIALPKLTVEPAEWEQAETLLGRKPQAILGHPAGYQILRYENAKEIGALTPDFESLAGLARQQFICTAPGEQSDIVSRVFVSGPGAREDDVTGSAHSALAPYWAQRLGRDRLIAVQASAAGGRLECLVDGGVVWLAGRCRLIRRPTLNP